MEDNTYSDMRILVIPPNIGYNKFKYLEKYFKTEFVNFSDKELYLQFPPRQFPSPARLKECFNYAESINNENYNCIIGCNLGGFLWATILRLSGVNCPLIIYADFNPAYFIPALAVMLFSQVSLPYDTVVTGSVSSCGIYKSFGLNSAAIFHYGIDLNLFSNKFDAEDKHKLRNKFGLPRDKRVILFTGRGAQDKNIHGLIEAFKKLNVKLPNTCLVITTIFDDERYMERCKNLAKSNGNIFFMNNLPVISLVELYSVADLFVTMSTSEYETFGRSPLEAMACGVPVVVPIYDGFKENVSEGCGYRVPVETIDGIKRMNTQDFVHAMSEALTNKEKASIFIRKGLENVKKYERSKSNRKFASLIASKKNIEIVEREFKNKEVSLEQYPVELQSIFKSYEKLPIKEAVIELFKRRFSEFSLEQKREYHAFIFKDF
ncbi:MAG: glycosyltransferase family 4 protein [Halobacteriota archaeon]